jgi:CheY-like chemotaxis protein
MPLMTGVEVAREVREMGNPLYIVGCTGNALREDQVSALSRHSCLGREVCEKGMAMLIPTTGRIPRRGGG